MKRERLLSGWRPYAIAAVCIMLLGVFGVAAQGFAKTRQQKNTSKPKPASTPAAEQKNNEEYGKKIKEFTTEKFFLTEMIDHLPASDTVPSPDKVIGYVIGTPNKLTYTKDMYRYYRELAKASPRVKIFTPPEKTEYGKEMMTVAIGSEEAMAKLDRYKEITAKLGDPRKITDADAQALIKEGKAFYWMSGSIHSPETGSPEMLMEMAYRLTVDESQFFQDIRKNLIVLITPTVEVDGRDTEVDNYNWRKANPGKPAPPLLYWGKYVAHDNNRDGLGMALSLTRNMMHTFLDFHPTILHDLHESVPFLYTSTGTGPYNGWLDPIVVDEWQLLAYNEIEEMTKRGVPGVWTHDYYDGWAPNYMFYVANGHNSIGRFYETFGGGGADTGERTVPANSTSRAWFRPNPPLPRVNWSIRNNINMQESALLFSLNFVANSKDRFLNNFYIKSKRSIQKAANEGPYAWVIPGDNDRPVEAADTVNLMRLMGIEINKSNGEFSVKDQKFPAGSYIIRMDQPYSRMADMLMDTQYFNVNDPRPYDDTGWTIGALRNVKTVRITDASVLNTPMTLLTSDAVVKGAVKGSATAAYVINHNTDNTLMALRFKLKDIKVDAAEDSFKVGDRQFNAGSFIIKSDGNPGDTRKQIEAAVTEAGVIAYSVGEVPSVKTHALSVPRIALVHTWTNTQNEGWYRVEFDHYKIPYTYISDHTIRDTPNLREKFDVIIFPPVGGTAQGIVNGSSRQGGNPVAWKQSDITPNYGLTPDQTDDMRGGMELTGVANLQKFIEGGGLFVTIGNIAQIPIDYGLASGVTIQDSRELQARGSVFNAQFADRKSPIAYGYGDSLPVYFSQAPLLQAGGFGGGGRGGGVGGGRGAGGGGGQGAGGGNPNRPSGRGGVNDPDVVSGMPQRGLSQGQPGGGGGDGAGGFGGGNAAGARPRVVLRFNSDEKNLLISGELAGGSELAGKAAVVDVPVGKGHVVMFANNPMWRHQTQGSFFLLFNAALNYDNLNAGQPARGGGRPDASSNDDDNDHDHHQ